MKTSLFRNLSGRHWFVAIGLALCLFGGSFLMAGESDELADLYYQTGLGNFKKGDYDQAVKKFQKALSYRKNFVPALFKLGEVSEKLNKPSAAVKYYRLSLRALESKTRLTKEEKDILRRTALSLGRLDKKKIEIEKVTARFIDQLIVLGKDCYKKKYHKFAGRCFAEVLLINPNHKEASQYVEKIGSVAPVRKKTNKMAEGRRIFNGKNLKGWRISEVSLKTWKVKKGELIADASNSATQYAILTWNGKVPRKYTISLEFMIEKKRSNQAAEVGFLYGKSQQELVIRVVKTSSLKKWHKLFWIKEGKWIIIKSNDGAKERVVDATDLSMIGLVVGRARVKFRNIVLEGLK